MTTLETRPIQLRTTTLAAAACEYGVRVYTKTAVNRIEDVGTDLTEKALGDAILNNKIELVQRGGSWFNASLPSVVCHPDSALCAFASGNWNQSLFYQDLELGICEYRHAGGMWGRSNFIEESAMRGSNLAVVHDSAAHKVILFFQDNDGYICSRTATSTQWSMTGVTWSENAQRIAHAAPGTGIGATAWNNLDEIRLYYQGTDNKIYEAKRSSGKEWDIPTGPLLDFHRPIGDITAVSWLESGGVQIRLYIQNERDVIVEWGYNGVTWFGGGFEQYALPNADVIAFVRPVPTKTHFCLHVLWAGHDQMLNQVVYPGDWAKWQTPSQIANIGSVGEYVGSWDGTQFSDVPLGLETKRIQRVVIRSGDVVDAIGLVFVDGTKSLVHGGGGGTGYEFVLEDGEEIVEIKYYADKSYLRCIKFVTSYGRASPEYGLLGEKELELWTRDGTSALAGFVGCTKSYGPVPSVVSGLAPIWSTRHALGLARLVDDWVGDAKILDTEVAEIDKTFKEAFAGTEKMLEKLGNLKKPAFEAMDCSVKLVESIEYLRDLQVVNAKARLHVTKLRRDAIDAQVAQCKVKSDDVEAKFKALIEALKTIIPDSDKLYEKITSARNDLANKKRRLDVLKSLMDMAHQMGEAESKKLEKEIADINVEIKKNNDSVDEKKGTEQKLIQQQKANQQSFRATDNPFLQIIQRADTTKEAIETVQDALLRLKQDLEKQNTLLEKKRKGLDGMTASLRTISEVHSRATDVLLVAERKFPDVEKLVAELSKLKEAVAKHALLLAEVAEASKPVDASVRAEEFAQKFAGVLQKALSSVYIQGLVDNDQLALQVVCDIAVAK